MRELFEKLGMTSRESAAFVELVRLGACPVSVWAKQTGGNRSSMYVMLERLKAMGLVSSFDHHGVLHIQAVAMSELPAILFDKQEQIVRTREQFLKSLPKLQKLEQTHGLVPKVSFYEGKSRVEAMYEKITREKSFKSFFHPGRVAKYMSEYFHKIPLMIRANNGSAKELLVDCDEARNYQKLYESKKHEMRVLPPSSVFSSDTIITEQKIFMIGYSDKGVVATEIWNEELAHTQSVVFDMVWNALQGHSL